MCRGVRKGYRGGEDSLGGKGQRGGEEIVTTRQKKKGKVEKKGILRDLERTPAA